MFQFLIGSLVTKVVEVWIKLIWQEFQFLIGSLVTYSSVVCKCIGR